MYTEADLLGSSLSYILGAVSCVGFLIIARNEIMLWLHEIFAKHRATAGGPVGANYAAISTVERQVTQTIAPARQISIILGLVFMGVIVSATIFILHPKAEWLELRFNLTNFMLVMLAFTLLPGGLTGIAAGAWINATRRRPQDHLLEGLLVGMLVYLLFFALFELTEVHLLLFLCGPAITLFVYQFLRA